MINVKLNAYIHRVHDGHGMVMANICVYIVCVRLSDNVRVFNDNFPQRLRCYYLQYNVRVFSENVLFLSVSLFFIYTVCTLCWGVMAHWLRRLLSTGGSWVRLPLWPSRRDLGQVLY